MPQENISIRGARVHTLKNIDVTIPRDKLVVITGLSGSGKSSLAFNTIFAEGQRRYVESLSTYARQFLESMEKPDVDSIDGLSPALAIGQKGTTQNPRSTVGTVTEIYDYLRLLYARIGHPHCPKCGREISQQTVQQMVDAVLKLPEGSRIMLLAPLVKEHQGAYEPIFDEVRRSGYVRVRVDGKIADLSDEIELDKQKKHTIEVVVDRLVIPEEIDPSFRQRATDSLETTLKLGSGIVLVSIIGGDEILFSEHPTCVSCGISLPEIAPHTFSFNSPHGACPTCAGLGVLQTVDPEQMADQSAMDTINRTQRFFLLSEAKQSAYQFFVSDTQTSIDPHGLVVEVRLSERERLIARQLLKEISARLQFLLDMGLDYLTLDRAAASLSGGEAQRIHLATQIGS